jgi:hypothetical protein
LGDPRKWLRELAPPVRSWLSRCKIGIGIARVGKVRFIGKAAMARNKLASGRPKDLVDAELLQSDE